ncbi:MAG: choice-of-anchor B family protein [Rhodothermales bacterium]|nr:choice-of-anchor B family protein [Rhodothermales bacterium]
MQHSKLVAGNAMSGDFFGLSLALRNGTALIGAPFRGENNDGDVHVFAYDESTDTWNDSGVLQKIPGVFDGSQFGNAIAMTDGMALVGVPGLTGGIGGAVMYRGGGGNWSFAGGVMPYVVLNGGSGSMLHIVGNDIWMGGSGMVFTFDGDGRGMLTGASLLADGEVNNWGTAAATSDDFAVVGAGGADGGLGAAYILENEDGKWTVAQRIEMEYTDLYPSLTGGQVNCADGQAQGWDCADVDLLSFMNIGDLGGGRGVRMNDVWGWTDPQTGREYAIAGRTNGTSFVDVTDPVNPVYLGDLPMTEGAQANSWRDMKVYADHVFIVADGSGQHGLQVFDLTRLRATSNSPVTFEADALYDGIASAHNIVINEQTGYAYAVGSNSGGETCGGGLHMINIQDPKNPEFAGCFGHEGTGNAGTGYSHDAMCVVYDGPDDEHDGKEICFGSNETALSIADVTDKENPVALASAAYPNVGYTHQGWITEDHRYFYINDELDETGGNADRTRTLIWDVSDLDEPELVKEHFGTTTASDHNLYVRDNLMYQSNYSAGLQILDVSDPENPVQVGMFDVNPTGNAPGFNGTWSNYPYFESGTIIVTGIESGLFMLKKREIDI